MRNPTPEQKQAAEDRRRRFRQLAKQIGDMSDAERSTLAAGMIGIATIEGRALSVHNVCLIARQNPAATLVGGFRQWLKAGRCVRKGEHGLMIWCASVRKVDEGQPDDTRFLVGTVFDVSQTDELPTTPAMAALEAAVA